MHTDTNKKQSSANSFLVSNDDDNTIPERVPVTLPFTIGRREGCDLCLTSPNVSGSHAEILDEDGQLWLCDLNSTNGTFLNDQRIRERVRLRENDKVLIGNHSFSVVCQSVSTGRYPMVTIENAATGATAETAEEKFHRLLDSGAVPFFQPVYDITGDNQRCIGYEVLGRSRMYGLSTPDQMFAAAMEFEKEAKLSRVLRQRGMEAAEVGLPSDSMLFVNTHPTELESGALNESLQEIRESFPSRKIVLEVPESILNSFGSFIDFRSLLLDLDIRLAIHDFGAGQIRLSELSELAPDIVKFDGALVQGIDKADSKRQRLVAAMTKMARELGITAMAECIELPAEHETLKQLGVQYAQGFHYGRPVDIKDITPNTNEQPEASETPFVAQTKNHRKNSNQNLIEELKQVEESEQETYSRPENKKIRNAEWLLEQSEDCYTVQLTMSSLESRAMSFIAKQDRPGDYAVYWKRGKLKEWFVVVYGIYIDRETAKTDSEAMKSTEVSPWIRTLSTVHAEIRTASVVE